MGKHTSLVVIPIFTRSSTIDSYAFLISIYRNPIFNDVSTLRGLQYNDLHYPWLWLCKWWISCRSKHFMNYMIAQANNQCFYICFRGKKSFTFMRSTMGKRPSKCSFSISSIFLWYSFRILISSADSKIRLCCLSLQKIQSKSRIIFVYVNKNIWTLLACSFIISYKLKKSCEKSKMKTPFICLASIASLSTCSTSSFTNSKVSSSLDASFTSFWSSSLSFYTLEKVQSFFHHETKWFTYT